MLNFLHTLAFTHRQFEVSKIGMLHISVENQPELLSQLKSSCLLDELLFLSTCNRVEITFITRKKVDAGFLFNLLQSLYPSIESSEITQLVVHVEHYSGIKAVDHAMSVASSIDSMIIGEREIITQVRLAYEQCSMWGLTGDLLRLINRHVVETAKKVYTHTSIATKPVSVVSLAYQQLKKLQISLDARILLIGAGVTNTTMSRFLKKHGFKQFTVFNRTLQNAQKLANELHGAALPISELTTYKDGFDVIITCTGADHHILTPEIYASLLQGETQGKTVIDIAIPQDLDPRIVLEHPVKHISVDVLQKISNQNLKERSKELEHVTKLLSEARLDFEKLYHERQVELAMNQVPKAIKKIKSTALDEVFKEDINSLDENSKAVLEKVLGYIEKKYIAGPMKMAKEILIKNG